MGNFGTEETGWGVIYLYRYDDSEKIIGVQKIDKEYSEVLELIKKSPHKWDIATNGGCTRLIDFHLEYVRKNSRRYDLDDVVKQLESMESEIYNLRREVECEIERVKKGGQDE